MSVDSIESDIYASLGLTRQDGPERSSNELAQEDFLKLMVTQLKHQDPFKPMENGDFLAQIAQFSSVSGIDQLNKSFSTLSQSMTSNQALQAGALVDREVLAPLEFGLLPQDGSLSGIVDLPSSAGNLVVSITDSAGALVREINLGTQAAGQIAFSWDGSTDSGDYAPPGVYQVRAQAAVGDENEALNTLIAARVDSVTLGSGTQGLRLNLEGLGPIAFSDVAQIH
ncbi:flagellar hook assembly protein FlgD [Pseudomonadota bacterium]